MNGFNDRLYGLLPTFVRIGDLATKSQPLRSLLSVISEQVDIVENDIAQLYANWFIETCQDWVVPYIGDLIGYQVLHEVGEPTASTTSEALLLDRILIPRQDVGNTVHARRRKGTLGVLPELARDVAGWPAIAVEFGTLASITQNVQDLRLARGRTLEVRSQVALERLGGPLDKAARTADVGGGATPSSPGSLPTSGVGLFVPRYRSYSVSSCAAAWIRDTGDHCFTFSALGDDVPLFSRPQTAASPGADPILPLALVRDAVNSDAVYGIGKSLAIWTCSDDRATPQLVAREAIVPADLTHWRHAQEPHTVAVDARRGRISFPRGHVPNRVLVAYYYGFSFEIGAGEYPRQLAAPSGVPIYRVVASGGETHGHLAKALEAWKNERPARAIVEFADSEIYDEAELNIDLEIGQHLEIRAASGARPVIRMIEWSAGAPDPLRVGGAAGTTLTLDGLVIAGRGLRVTGELAHLIVKSSTLVPGWSRSSQRSRHGVEPSIAVVDAPTSLRIERSIIGPLEIQHGERTPRPTSIEITDSILDAADHERAIASPDARAAYVRLRIVRTTVFGAVHAHGVSLAENTIFDRKVTVTDRQHGCFRFCYVPPGSRTPPRYECQPAGTASASPVFASKRYDDPGYARLSDATPASIMSGADDRSEMGAFHNLFRPQREANLQARLAEYVPAGIDVSVIFVS